MTREYGYASNCECLSLTSTRCYRPICCPLLLGRGAVGVRLICEWICGIRGSRAFIFRRECDRHGRTFIRPSAVAIECLHSFAGGRLPKGDGTIRVWCEIGIE